MKLCKSKPCGWYIDCVDPLSGIEYRSFANDKASVTVYHKPMYEEEVYVRPDIEKAKIK